MDRLESEIQIDVIHESLEKIESLQIAYKRLKLNDETSDKMLDDLKQRFLNRLYYIESLYNQD